MAKIKPLVFSIHGIRTRGKWQKDLSRVLSENDFAYEPLDFGWFSSLRLVIPGCRRKMIGWFLKEYTAKRPKDGTPPSIIAHSFGTYVVAMAMRKYAQIRFDKIIFCGSIVYREYHWTAALNSERCNIVLNDYGSLDRIAALAKWAVKESGDSGTDGFTEQDQRLVQEKHLFGHSEYFYALNYEQRWLPFLKGNPLPPHEEENQIPPNRYFMTMKRLLIGLGIVLLVLAIWFLWLHPFWKYTKFDAITFPVFSSEFVKARDGDTLKSFAEKYQGESVTWNAVIRGVGSKDSSYWIEPLEWIKPSKKENNFPWQYVARFADTDFDSHLAPDTQIEISGVIDKCDQNNVTLHDCKLNREKIAPRNAGK